MRETASQYKISRSSTYAQDIFQILHTKSNSDSNFQQLPIKKDITRLKGCWRRCYATMSSSDKKIFTVEAVIHLATDASDLPEGVRTHLDRIKPAGVMV